VRKLDSRIVVKAISGLKMITGYRIEPILR